MSWECTRCGATDLNGEKCPFCGEQQQAALRIAKLKSPSKAPFNTRKQNISPLISVFAAIGMLGFAIISIVNIFTSTSNYIIDRSESDDARLRFYANIGMVMTVTLMLCALCGLITRRP